MAEANDKGKKVVPKAVEELYNDRLNIMKKGLKAQRAEKLLEAITAFHEYLNIISAYKGVEEKNLNPNLFDKNKDSLELLLISNVYWGLSKAYDRNPKCLHELNWCLKQYVSFSLGFKFQYANSEMIRKFIRRGKIRNSKAFEAAWKRLMEGKKVCYVATYCFGESDPITDTCRDFRDFLLNYWIGRKFVAFYYHFSPDFVDFCEQHKRFGKAVKYVLVGPSIKFFAMLIRRFINK